jgi:hypothetical protein
MKNILDIYFKDYDFDYKNVIEFGPCVTKDRIGIIKHLLFGSSNIYAIDACQKYSQTPEEAMKLSCENNFTLEIADYTPLLKDPINLINQYKIFKEKFFDVILCQCSIEFYQIKGFLTLCDIIGTKECKVFCLPFLNSPEINAHSYKEEINKIHYGEYRLTELENEEIEKINYIMKYNAIITKNINI